MIFDFLVQFIAGTVEFLTRPLRNNFDDVTLPDQITQSLEDVFSGLSAFSFAFPVDTFIEILIIIVVFEFGYLTYKGAMWLIRRLPTQS
ncbi:MAG: hypothetical protein ACOC2U_01130 [bacterium]